MRFHRLSAAPVFAGFGILMDRRDPGASGVAPGELAAHLRRMDRYGAIGFAAARAALDDAGVPPPAEPDAQWGVNVGSSLGCWSGNARFYSDLLRQTVAGVSPALFVRTVSNAVTGDVSIALRLGGASETFVSGWTAGAEAVASAGAALDENRARRMLAGAVEAPGDMLPLHAMTRDDGRHGAAPVEAAAFALLTRDAAAAPSASLKLRAFWRGHDPSGRWSLRAALDATAEFAIGCVVAANAMPAGVLDRFRSEAGGLPLVPLAERHGEMGAAGALVALSIAARGDPGGTLVVSRGEQGSVVALAVSRES